MIVDDLTSTKGPNSPHRSAPWKVTVSRVPLSAAVARLLKPDACSASVTKGENLRRERMNTAVSSSIIITETNANLSGRILQARQMVRNGDPMQRSKPQPAIYPTVMPGPAEWKGCTLQFTQPNNQNPQKSQTAPLNATANWMCGHLSSNARVDEHLNAPAVQRRQPQGISKLQVCLTLLLGFRRQMYLQLPRQC